MAPSTMQEFLSGINWELLKEQRRNIIALITDIADWGGDSAAANMQAESLAGVLELLDALTDEAAAAGLNPPFLTEED